MKVLVSWIGHTDIRFLLNDCDEATRNEISKNVRQKLEPPANGGPIKTILSHEKFDKLYLISNLPEKLNYEYVKCLGFDADLTNVIVTDPSDYNEIFKIEDSFLNRVFSENSGNDSEVSILLSPGTPTMVAVWVLLGKTKYIASFWQTFNGVAKQYEIPFDITLDVIPELLSRSDSAFSHLTDKSPSEIKGFESITGNSSAIRFAVGRARKAAMHDVSVLLTGESGTGKEVFARAIHKASSRSDKPFVAINCAAIPKELLESELFGHKKDAFTGAIKDKDGAFKLADGGFLFLDEVGECDPQLQAKLLRVLQPPPGEHMCLRQFSPVGSPKVESSDVRVLAATNRDLIKMVSKGKFRDDLIYRLAVISIRLPALRERISDISLLADNLLSQINKEFSARDESYKCKQFCPDTKIFMKKQRWSGNIRELYNVILQSAVMCGTEKISVDDIEAAMLDSPGEALHEDDGLCFLGDGFSLDDHLNSIQARYLKKAMKDAGGVKSKAASLLGLNSYQTLDARMSKLGIKSGDA